MGILISKYKKKFIIEFDNNYYNYNNNYSNYNNYK